MALQVLKRVEPHQPPPWAHYSLLGTVFVGAVIGMVVVGWLGDWLGPSKPLLRRPILPSFLVLARAYLRPADAHAGC